MGNDAEMQALLRAVGSGRLRPVVDSVFPLARAAEAYARLESEEGFGKVVLEI